MNTFKISTCRAEETVHSGTRLARFLEAGDIVCLFGELGSGKTTFVKGLAKGLRIQGSKVVSPTFVLLNIYEGKLPLYHFDFYRLEKINEIALLGFEEFFYGQGICVIEWADRLGDLMPKGNLAVCFSHKGEDKREIAFKGLGPRYKRLIEKCKGSMKK